MRYEVHTDVLSNTAFVVCDTVLCRREETGHTFSEECEGILYIHT